MLTVATPIAAEGVEDLAWVTLDGEARAEAVLPQRSGTALLPSVEFRAGTESIAHPRTTTASSQSAPDQPLAKADRFWQSDSGRPGILH